MVHCAVKSWRGQWWHFIFANKLKMISFRLLPAPLFARWCVGPATTYCYKMYIFHRYALHTRVWQCGHVPPKYIFYTRDATTNIYFLFYFGKRMCRMYSVDFEQGLFRQLTFLASLSVSYFIMSACDVTRLIIRTVLRKRVNTECQRSHIQLDYRRQIRCKSINSSSLSTPHHFAVAAMRPITNECCSSSRHWAY